MYTTDYDVKLAKKQKASKIKTEEKLILTDINFNEKLNDIISLSEELKKRCLELYSAFPKKDLSDMIIDIDSFCKKNVDILN